MELLLTRYNESTLKGNGTYNNLLELCSEVQNIVENDDFMKSHWDEIVYLTHSTFRKKSEKAMEHNEKTTNAYWKMTEIWNHFKFDLQNINHFDIACAPGYFIMAMKMISKKNNINYSFKGFTLQDGLDLDDDLKNNENIFFQDILKNDLDDNLKQYYKKYNLVTGDIGIKCNYEQIEELQLIELERKQMETALKLVSNGGYVVLKMFTYSQKETIRLVDEFSKHFDKSYIYKPYSSRVLNNESYLIGIHYDVYTNEGKGTNAEGIEYFEKERQSFRKNILQSATLLTKLKRAQYEISKLL